jgi:hypothetical protein
VGTHAAPRQVRQRRDVHGGERAWKARSLSTTRHAQRLPRGQRAPQKTPAPRTCLPRGAPASRRRQERGSAFKSTSLGGRPVASRPPWPPPCLAHNQRVFTPGRCVRVERPLHEARSHSHWNGVGSARAASRGTCLFAHPVGVVPPWAARRCITVSDCKTGCWSAHGLGSNGVLLTVSIGYIHGHRAQL